VAACIGCHGPTGAGNPAAKFPRLAGQHAKYVENQLRAFKSGERDNDAGKMMRNIAGRMTEKEIRAVASYVQGLH
jgi:cytochrome c553